MTDNHLRWEIVSILYRSLKTTIPGLSDVPDVDMHKSLGDWADEILKVVEEAIPEPVYEYWWKSDIWSPHAYEFKETAEEFIGNPKQFRRIKAGPWEEVK